MSSTPNAIAPASQEAAPTTATTLSEREIVRAATNSPALASDQFQLGDRIFKIVDLPYDDYIVFISYLQPLVEVMFHKLAEKVSVNVPGINITSESFSTHNIIGALGKTLPEMAHIICRQTDPNITVEDVKKLAKKPAPLAQLVLKQIKQNGVIKDFADFFAQMGSLLPQLKK